MRCPILDPWRKKEFSKFKREFAEVQLTKESRERQKKEEIEYADGKVKKLIINGTQMNIFLFTS